MSDNRKISEAENIKKSILDNVAVNDQVVCAFCDRLISLAKGNHDWQSVAYGYVWRADYFCYVESDLKAVSRELYYAQIYIDEENPSELLEKYYTLKRVLYEQTYDIQSAFQYSLKALEVAELLDIRFRIGANYGNLATYYLNYGCYDDALLYSEQAMEVFRALPEKQPRIMRVLLCNLIKIYLKLGRTDRVLQMLKELQALPLEKKDLQIYVDYGYMIYYSAMGDAEGSLSYLDAIFRHGLMELSNRTYIIEILTDGLDSMISLNNKEKSKELIQLLESYMKEEEIEPLLKLCGQKILYARKFKTAKECSSCYKEYYQRYTKAQALVRQLKNEGLRTGLELNDACTQYDQSRKELDELYNMVNYDELTKVYNRHYFNIRLEEMLNSAEYSNLGYAIIDVDYFKEYNDYYGHAAGDEVLRQVAASLKDETGDDMLVARYGGDEFVCLSSGFECEKITAYVQRAAAALREKNIEHIKSRCSQQVTLSIGYGCRRVSNKVEVLAFFDKVDHALYNAKSSGRNCARTITDLEP